MEIIRDNQVIYTMSKDNAPVARVASGSTLVFETQDCFGNQITSAEQGISQLDWSRINPATGPVWVEGAMPGDVLRVSVEKIETSGHGVMAAVPGEGVFGDQVTEASVRTMEFAKFIVGFAPDILLPLRPMIGVIGVAPSEEGIPCGTPGRHGGNMDNTRIGEGSVLYLPVQCPGALLAMGDVHACMGDGEVMVTGVETAAKVTVKVEVVKGLELEEPMLEAYGRLYVICSRPGLEEAIRDSANIMLHFVMKKLNLSLNDAGMLLSACGNAEICQMVDPLKTARFSVLASAVGPLTENQ